MITGAHSIVYSTNPDADRAFLREVLRLSSVDVGEGWLIFGLPPAEVAVHPSDKNDVHELYFMCDDVEDFIGKMTDAGVSCLPVQDQGWGLLTQLTLPGGGKLGVYQPRHARPSPMGGAPAPAASKKPAKAVARKPVKKPAAKKAPPPKKTKTKTKTKPALKAQAAKPLRQAKKKGKRR
jgi:hypothetical protein